MLSSNGLDVADGPPPGFDAPAGAVASSIIHPPPGLTKPPDTAADHVWELLVVKMWDQMQELRETQQLLKDHMSIVHLQKIKDADRLDDDAERIVDLETLMHSLRARVGNLEQRARDDAERISHALDAFSREQSIETMRPKT